MVKSGTEPVQQRDEAVRAERAVPPVPRLPGERAILISERSARWDRPAAEAAPLDPMAEVTDPLWDHKGGTVWTPDLVYCRLLIVGEITARMPGSSLGSLKSFLGNMVVSVNDGPRKAPLTPQQISLADWTWTELLKLPPDRYRIMSSRAFDLSYDKIAAALSRQGRTVTGPTIRRWETAERRMLAAGWQKALHPVDARSFGRWQDIFTRRK